MTHVAVVEFRGQRSVHELSLGEHARIVIGRGWDSDIVVDDEFVDAAHMELGLDATGELWIKDLDTLNGTRLGKRSLRGAAAYEVGTRMSFGESVLAVYEADADVAPATRFDTVNVLSRRFGSPSWTIFATVLAAMALLGELRLLGAEEIGSELVTEGLAGLAVMATLWCLSGGMMGKVFRHRAHFGLHWGVACLIVVGVFVMNFSGSVLAFNLDSRALDHLLRPALEAALAFVLCFTFLSLSTRLRRVSRLALGTLAAMLPIVFSLVIPALQEEHERWSPVAIAETVRQPAGMLFATPKTVDAHFATVDGLFSTLGSAGHDRGTPSNGELADGGKGGSTLSLTAE